MIVFALFDRKATTYLDPFSAPKEEVAIRQIQIALREGRSLIAQFAEDFELYQLGYFDQASGAISPDLQFIGNVADLRGDRDD